MAKLSKKLLLVALALVLVVSVALTAACEEKTYALTYAAGEGTGTAPAAEQIAEGTEVTLKANMFTAPEGKEFAGWLVEGETTAREAGSKMTMPAKAVTLTAQWKAKSEPQPTKYALTYDAGEGTGAAPAAEQIAEGAEVTLKANMFTAPEGKEFDGWLVDGAKKAAGDKITMPAKALTITAQWKTTTPPQPTTYALTYDAGEGTGAAPAAEQIAEGAEVTLKANMFTAPEGKEFDGWLVDGAKKAAGDKITMPAKALTITAQWKTTEPQPEAPAITAAANISIQHKGETTIGWLFLEADGEGSFFVADKANEENILLEANITYTIDSEGELKIVSASASGVESSPIVVPAVGSIVGHTVSITIKAAEGEAQYKFESEVYKLRIEYGFEIEEGVSVTENYIPVGQIADFTDIEREGYTLKAIKANGVEVSMEAAKELAMPAMDATIVYEWEEAQPEPTPEITVYFYNVDGWEIVNAHMWVNQGGNLTGE